MAAAPLGVKVTQIPRLLCPKAHVSDSAEEGECWVNAGICNGIKMLCLLYMLHILKIRRNSTIKGQMNLLSLTANSCPQLSHSLPWCFTLFTCKNLFLKNSRPCM